MRKKLTLILSCAVISSLPVIGEITSAKTATEIIVKTNACEFSETLHEINDAVADVSSDIVTDFPSNKLIVFSDNEFNCRGAEYAITNADGMHVLVYHTPEQAESAYRSLSEDDSLNVMPDIKFSIPTEVLPPQTANPSSEFQIASTEHLSWGAEFIGTDAFFDTLYNNYGTPAKMPKVTVAVIDTGVDYEHSFLNDRIIGGYDYSNDDDDPMDDNGHGTHVAGIICDNTTPNVKILAYKTLNNEGEGNSSDILSAMLDARNNGAKVINLSLAADDLDGTAYQALHDIYYDEIISKGVTIVAAAGNERRDAQYSFPSNMDEVITVSGCDSNGDFDDTYSNFGNKVDLCAPGTAVLSAYPDERYAYMKGTSMACPHAAAAAALLITADTTLTPEQVKQHLIDGSVKRESTYNYGKGYLNLKSLAKSFAKLPQLITVEVNSGYISFDILRPESIPDNGADITVAGYIDDTLAAVRTFHITESDCTGGVRLSDTNTEFDSVKLYLWNNLGLAEPISKFYEID